MSRLRPDKLHVTLAEGVEPDGPALPRRYTLTHSDRTGDLFLTIGRDYDHRQLFAAHPALDQAPVHVHFQARQARYDKVEGWGQLIDYRIP